MMEEDDLQVMTVHESGDEDDSKEDPTALEAHKIRCEEMRVMAGAFHCQLEDAPAGDILVKHCEDIMTYATMVLSGIEDPTTRKQLRTTPLVMKHLEAKFVSMIALGRMRGLMAYMDKLDKKEHKWVAMAQETAPAMPQKRTMPDEVCDRDGVASLVPVQDMYDTPSSSRIDGTLTAWTGEGSQLDCMMGDIFGDEIPPSTNEGTGETPPTKRIRRSAKGPK